jgi:hypothetical protein
MIPVGKKKVAFLHSFYQNNGPHDHFAGLARFTQTASVQTVKSDDLAYSLVGNAPAKPTGTIPNGQSDRRTVVVETRVEVPSAGRSHGRIRRLCPESHGTVPYSRMLPGESHGPVFTVLPEQALRAAPRSGCYQNKPAGRPLFQDVTRKRTKSRSTHSSHE